ncbi:cysteine-rich CWC family protein [Acetobacter persici]|uniref:cysteine-rich CWC family protein n=1 Tax=Acetobacter persici TaxID=1076596 RepID=UPI0039E7BF59
MICEICGADFPCTADSQCWCMQVPHAIPLPAGEAPGCVCPACLERLIRQSRAGEHVSPEQA